MEYHRSEEPLALRQYGRGVQQMVAALLQEPDAEVRMRMAHQTVRVMGLLAEQHEEDEATEAQEQKLWDHLQRMSGYRLGPLLPDAPYVLPPPPAPELAQLRLPYPRQKAAKRQYGQLIERLLARWGDLPPGAGKDLYARQIASYMKLTLLAEKGRATADPSLVDQLIADQLWELTQGGLRLDLSQPLPVGVAPQYRTPFTNASQPLYLRKRKKLKAKVKPGVRPAARASEGPRPPQGGSPRDRNDRDRGPRRFPPRGR